MSWVRLILFVAMVGVIAASYALAYRAGKQVGRTQALQRTIELLRERNKVDEEVKNMGDAEFCAALGWRVLPDGSCGPM